MYTYMSDIPHQRGCVCWAYAMNASFGRLDQTKEVVEERQEYTQTPAGEHAQVNI